MDPIFNEAIGVADTIERSYVPPDWLRVGWILHPALVARWDYIEYLEDSLSNDEIESRSKKALALCPQYESEETCYKLSEFDRQAWLGGDPERRGEMVGRFLVSGWAIGRSASEVTALLGKPDKQDNNELMYWVAVPSSGKNTTDVVYGWLVLCIREGIVDDAFLTDPGYVNPGEWPPEIKRDVVK